MQVRNKMQDVTFADVDFSVFIFKLNQVFKEGKDNPVERVVIDEEEPDGIEIDAILKLQNLPRVFIDQECWNLNLIVDGGELSGNINKKKSDVQQAYKCPLYGICYRRECFFNKHVKYSE